MKYCATCHTSYPSEYKSCPVDASALRSTSELVQGMLIRGKYEVLNKIGAGGMATVYRARHIAFNEIRAIKVVRGWMADDDTFVKRLRMEAVISRRLNHPNAVRVDDIDDLEDGRPFIVMEFVEGQNLRFVIKQTGPLGTRRALEIASQVASALSAAHALGITHRDIKPDNILLPKLQDGSETVKVLDFGIAKLRDVAATGSIDTATGLVMCTPEYASPEQARGGQSSTIDHRSDLYSLGVVLYEMCTGDLPFHSDTPLGMLLAHINTRPRPPAEVRPGLTIPKAVCDLLMKALEKDRDRRFQSAQEMLDAIARIDPEAAERGLAPFARTRNTRGTVIEMPSRATTGPGAAPRMEPERQAEPETVESASIDLLTDLDEPRRRWPWIVGALLVLVAAAAFIYVAYFNGPSDAQLERDVRQQLSNGAGTAALEVSVRHHVAYISGEAVLSAANDASLIATAVPGITSVDTSGVHDSSVDRAKESPVPSAPPRNNDTAVTPASVGPSAVPPPPVPSTPTSASKQPTPAATGRAVEAPVSGEEQTRKSVETALKGIPHTENITVAVKNGVVTLHGTTDSEETKRQANDAISIIAGVADVNVTDVRVLDAAKDQKVRKLLRDGQTARDDAEYDRAIEVYQQVLQLDPGNKEAQKGLRAATNSKAFESTAGEPSNDPQ